MRNLIIFTLAILTYQTGFAQVGDPEADLRVKTVLDQAGLKYDIDDDKDFKLVFITEQGDSVAKIKERTQLVLINSKTMNFEELDVREVWSVAYELSDGPVADTLLASLMKKNANLKLGGWCYEEKENGYRVYFSIKISPNMPKDPLYSILTLVANKADELEKELTGDLDKF